MVAFCFGDSSLTPYRHGCLPRYEKTQHRDELNSGILNEQRGHQSHHRQKLEPILYKPLARGRGFVGPH